MKTALKRIISNLFTGIFQYDSARKFWSILGQTTRRNTEPRELVVSSEHGYLKHAPLSAYFQYTFRSTPMVSAAPRNYKIVKKNQRQKRTIGENDPKKTAPSGLPQTSVYTCARQSQLDKSPTIYDRCHENLLQHSIISLPPYLLGVEVSRLAFYTKYNVKTTNFMKTNTIMKTTLLDSTPAML